MGLLLRSDVHTLFDLGYMTVNPDDKRMVVSSRIREEFENGRNYYALHGSKLLLPKDRLAFPSTDSLIYHFEQVYRS